MKRWLLGLAIVLIVAAGAFFGLAPGITERSLNKIDGKLAWVRELPEFKDGNKEQRIVWTGPLVASNKLVLASSEGDVIALSPQDGKTTNEMKLGQSIFIEPIAADGKVFVLTDQANLVAIK